MKNHGHKNTATSNRLIKAVYGSYVYAYIVWTSQSGRLEYNSLFVGLGGWGGVRGSGRKMCQLGVGYEQGGPDVPHCY